MLKVYCLILNFDISSCSNDYSRWFQVCLVSAPTTKAVGSKLVTTYEPTALVVGARKRSNLNF